MEQSVSIRACDGWVWVIVSHRMDGDAVTHTFGSQNIFLMRSFLLYDFAKDLLHNTLCLSHSDLLKQNHREPTELLCLYKNIDCTSTVLLVLYKHRCKLNATCKWIPWPLLNYDRLERIEEKKKILNEVNEMECMFIQNSSLSNHSFFYDLHLHLADALTQSDFQ